MKVSLRRLQRSLALSAFEVAWECRDDESAVVRSSQVHNELFELVIVGWAGEGGKTVFADAAVSVLRGWPTKGLIETEQVTEIDDDHEHRWSVIGTRAEAENWELRLASLAPDRCKELAAREGPGLLQRTQQAREAAQKYLSQLPMLGSPEQAAEWLGNQCTADERTEADRLLKWPGVLQIEGGELLYAVAALLVVRFSDEVEGGVPGGLPDPIQNVELMWRLQLLRDRLAALWPGAIAAA